MKSLKKPAARFTPYGFMLIAMCCQKKLRTEEDSGQSVAGSKTKGQMKDSAVTYNRLLSTACIQWVWFLSIDFQPIGHTLRTLQRSRPISCMHGWSEKCFGSVKLRMSWRGTHHVSMVNKWDGADQEGSNRDESKNEIQRSFRKGPCDLSGSKERDQDEERDLKTYYDWKDLCWSLWGNGRSLLHSGSPCGYVIVASLKWRFQQSRQAGCASCRIGFSVWRVPTPEEKRLSHGPSTWCPNRPFYSTFSFYFENFQWWTAVWDLQGSSSSIVFNACPELNSWL